MNTKEDGGPAFPVPHFIKNYETGYGTGLTMRDYFAINILNGELSNQYEGKESYGRSESMERLVGWCYEMADLMLKARK